MKLTLIRHGNTEGNEKKLYYGSTDLPLSTEGRDSLARLAEVYFYPRAERYYTSGMLRTEQSFVILYGDIPHEKLEDMREIDFGSFEMRRYSELIGDPDYLNWITGDNEKNVCPGGESGESVTARALRVVNMLLDSNEDAAVITHGGVIGGLMARFFPAYAGRFAYTPEPGFGYTVTFDDRIPVCWNAVPGKRKQ